MISSFSSVVRWYQSFAHLRHCVVEWFSRVGSSTLTVGGMMVPVDARPANISAAWFPALTGSGAGM